MHTARSNAHDSTEMSVLHRSELTVAYAGFPASRNALNVGNGR